MRTTALPQAPSTSAAAQTAGDNTGTAEAQSGNGIARLLSRHDGCDEPLAAAALPALDPELLRGLRAGRLEAPQEPHAQPRHPLQHRHASPRSRGRHLRLRSHHPQPARKRPPRRSAFRRHGPWPATATTASSWPTPYYKNIEPRIGFAYSPGWLHDSTVLRGAYTIMVGPLIYADYGQGLSAGLHHLHAFGEQRPLSAFGLARCRPSGAFADPQHQLHLSDRQRCGLRS